jgi:Ser/Thr protein kinase RdoA (MazF antagonist)
LHKHATNWPRPREFKRHDWRRISMFTEAAAPRDVWDLLPDEHRREFAGVKTAAVRVCKRMSAGGDTGLLHADLHGFNVLRTDRGLAAIDFDDCGFAPWVYDVAVTCGFWRSRHRERYAALMEGYHRVREFPANQLQHLPLMIAARLAGVCLWLTGRAQENAKFRSDLRKNQNRLLKRAREALARQYS